MLVVMTTHRPIWSSFLFTIVFVSVGIFAICYYPMSSVLREPTTPRIALASAFVACMVANVVLCWVEPKSRFVSDMLSRGLGGLGFILLLCYS